jgi:hypothetical protein
VLRSHPRGLEGSTAPADHILGPYGYGLAQVAFAKPTATFLVCAALGVNRTAHRLLRENEGDVDPTITGHVKFHARLGALDD